MIPYGSLLNIENVKRREGITLERILRATLFSLDTFHFIDGFIYIIDLLVVII
jgi:hypothetical protein